MVAWLITVCHEVALAMISTWLTFHFSFFLPFPYFSFMFVLRHVYITAKSACYVHDVHQCVLMFACISSAPTGWISVKFGIEDFYENLSRYSKYG